LPELAQEALIEGCPKSNPIQSHLASIYVTPIHIMQ